MVDQQMEQGVPRKKMRGPPFWELDWNLRVTPVFVENLGW